MKKTKIRIRAVPIQEKIVQKRSLPRPLRSLQNIPQTPPPPDNPNLPFWLPTVDSCIGLSKKVQQKLQRIILPAYRVFVLEAPTEMERSLGNSVVYLSWIELVHQLRLANVLADPNGADAILHAPETLMNRYLEILAVKCQATELIFKFRLASEALNRLTQSRPPTPPQLPPTPSPLPNGIPPTPSAPYEALPP